MALITLKKFQTLSQLSDAALVWLLANNKLPCHYDPDTGLSIETRNVALDELVTAVSALKASESAGTSALLTEHVQKILAQHFEEVVEEAVARLATTQLTTVAEEE